MALESNFRNSSRLTGQKNNHPESDYRYSLISTPVIDDFVLCFSIRIVDIPVLCPIRPIDISVLCVRIAGVNIMAIRSVIRLHSVNCIRVRRRFFVFAFSIGIKECTLPTAISTSITNVLILAYLNLLFLLKILVFCTSYHPENINIQHNLYKHFIPVHYRILSFICRFWKKSFIYFLN